MQLHLFTSHDSLAGIAFNFVSVRMWVSTIRAECAPRDTWTCHKDSIDTFIGIYMSLCLSCQCNSFTKVQDIIKLEFEDRFAPRKGGKMTKLFIPAYPCPNFLSTVNFPYEVHNN